MSDVIAFRKVKEPYGWLGNMSPHKVGVWKTSEHAFQALRFLNPEIRALIGACSSPMQAKMVAKKHAQFMTTIPRSHQDVENMKRILREKLRQNPELIEKLLALAGRTIIEDCTARANESGLFWGAALQIDSSKPGTVIWHGENVLGKLWMEIRDGILATLARREGTP